MSRTILVSLSLVCTVAAAAAAAEPEVFQPTDIFQLEWASDPQISADGRRIAYVRNFMDIMTDRRGSDIWIVTADGADHRPLVAGDGDQRSPRWSPDGEKLLYASSAAGSTPVIPV